MPVGLNIGSGQRKFKTDPDEIVWLNIDSVAKWEPDIVCDGAHLEIRSDSVDYVVLHHVLEHFGCGEANGLVSEAYRVLKPGGSLIVCVPDLSALAKRWTDGELDTQIYVTNLYGAYMGNEEDRHKWGYTFDSLGVFLKSCSGWLNVRRFDFRQIPGADIAQDWWILGMEARK